MSQLIPGTIAKQWQYCSAADDTGTTAIEVAPAKAGYRNYVAGIQVANRATTPGTYVHLLSASTIIWSGFVSNYVVAAPGESYISSNFMQPIYGAVGEAISVKAETAAQLRWTVQGFAAKAS